MPDALTRDLDLNQETAWYIVKRIRAEIAKKDGALILGVFSRDL